MKSIFGAIATLVFVCSVHALDKMSLDGCTVETQSMFKSSNGNQAIMNPSFNLLPISTASDSTTEAAYRADTSFNGVDSPGKICVEIRVKNRQMTVSTTAYTEDHGVKTVLMAGSSQRQVALVPVGMPSIIDFVVENPLIAGLKLNFGNDILKSPSFPLDKEIYSSVRVSCMMLSK